ncbi:unnamed protein product [Rotaria sordida]|uniref:Uncharacterized protein n=1 Tax=Rotaria sordida TaxID=392033 RepID=A0A815IAL7_9BILA|nr:unnamed protein product [Rotaria sordida]CAF3983757.1 unnamed protein product [Rotaria sordida]
MMNIDLNNLPDEVLFYSNDQFYKFIEDCLGVDEMKLLKLQSIKNIRTLLNVPDVFAIFSINCKELADLKNNICFIDDDNDKNAIVKSGIKAGIDYLITILKEKNNKYIKRKKNSKPSPSLLSSTTNRSNSNTPLSNTSVSDFIDSSLTSTPTATPNLMPINDYIDLISNSIEKFSINTFKNVILNNNDDYVICLTLLHTNINGHIKCGCKTTIKLCFRPNRNSFQLSSYFKHLKAMASMEQELLPFLENLSSYSDDVFYTFVKEFVGVIEGEILETQRIKNVRILLQVPDVFSFLQINSTDILKLKERACFVTDDLQYIVRPGIKSNIEQFIKTLRKYYESTSANVNFVSSQTTSNVFKETGHCMCDLMDIYKENQSKSFINIFVNNLLNNMKRSSNNYQFDPIVNKFASVLNILAGNNAYEFIRLNLPGSLPSTTTLKAYNQDINLQLKESDFRFNSLKDYLELIDSNHVFVSEDSTGVVSSVSYDSKNNGFVGFSPRLVNGVPLVDQFQTNSYTELQKWFEEFDKSSLITVNLIEPILKNLSSLVHSRPFIISSYGTNNKYTAVDVLRKWMFMYNECKKKNINIVGFSADAEPRNLKAMQLSLGFFAKTPNIDLLSGNNTLLKINIESPWNFFFIRLVQPYLCMQDGIHLVTKIRNRLLSETASMSINNQEIDVNHLFYIIQNYPKIDHNLVHSDVFPHDRQNYSSCLKITSDDVLNLLKHINASATYVYLYLLKLIILTYVKADTDILARLYYGWIVTFSYRMWWSSLQIKRNFSQKEKDNCFITRAAWLSSELNVHCLTAIIILVSEGRLPSYAINTHLFSSQPCEATFRSARSLTGTLSSITNFSVFEFLQKIGKISILNQIKSTEETNDAAHSLKFPIHHKNRHRETTMSINTPITSTITTYDIEKIIVKAYAEAQAIMDSLQLTKTLRENNLNDFKKLNEFVFQQLDGKSTIDYSYFNEEDLHDSADNDINSNSEIAVDLSETNLETNECCSDEDEANDYHLTSSKETFEGMRVYDQIDPSKKSHYFQIIINYKQKFIHKQTAARLLSINKNCLSSDRRTRVQQTSKQR